MAKWLIWITLWLGLSLMSRAVVVVEYDAGTAGNPATAPDPLSQGWAGGGASSIGVSPDGITGLNAWQVTDASSALTDSYLHPMSTAEHSAATANGWSLQTRMRLDPAVTGADTMMLIYDNSSVRWILFIDLASGTGSNYDLKVFGGTADGDTGIAEDGNYHTFELRGSDGSSAAEVYVDGILMGTAGTLASVGNGISFGSGSSGGQGIGLYNQVQMDLPGYTPSNLEPARIFADHMVLQRGEPLPVYGTDTPGQTVTLSFAGQVKVTTTDGAGAWRVDLDPLAASTTGRTMTIAGSSTILLEDILVGEVWLAAGQSNMRFTVNESSNSPHPEHYGLIRMCNWEGTVGVRKVYDATDLAKLTPEHFYAGNWELLDAGTVGAQSAVAYFFANALARELKGTGPGGSDIPVGVFELAYGGTSTEAFIDPAAHTNDYLKAVFADPASTRTLGQWSTGIIASDLSATTHTDPTKPHPHPFAPGFLYHTGMAHAVPFAFKGAIWYQGESNAEFTTDGYRWNGDRLSDYQSMVMKTLVDSWRAAFNKPAMPFYMVQLPRISASNRAKWPWYREAQMRVARDLEGVDTAVVMEFGVNGSNVHPANKEPVAERLALLARHHQYGESSLVYSGPVYTHQEIGDRKIVLHFDHVHGGLVAQDGQPLRHFEIAGQDRTFIAAEAVIVGDTVEVSASAVPDPVAVRYGWDMNIDVNFYHADGLPASPFRTDDWVAAPGRVIRVACIGDSITAGSGIAQPAVDGYPAQLGKLLGTRLFEVRNFGKSGAGVHRPANKYDASTQFAEAVAFAPDIVICNLGINDITHWGTYTREDFIAEYRELVDAFASLPTDPLFTHWHELGPLFPGQNFYGDPNLVTLNQWVADSAGTTGARTLDMYQSFKDHPEWYPDKIHPNEAGARAIAEETLLDLLTVDALHGKPRIQEFLAVNTTGIQDEDGERPGWIELANEGATGMNVGRYHLSDREADPLAWSVPAKLLLEPGQSMLVFTSGKNRALKGAELHSDFILPAVGGYLSLADPAGVVVQAFQPVYPAQYPDVSYGLEEGEQHALMSPTATVRMRVPADGALGTTWTATGFDDHAWTEGTLGVGYDNGSRASASLAVAFDGPAMWNTTFQNGWGDLNGGGAVVSLDGSALVYDHSSSTAATTLDGTSSTLDGGTTTWATGNDGDWTLEIRLTFLENPNGFAIWASTGTHRIILEMHGDHTRDWGGESYHVPHNNLDGLPHVYRIAHDASGQVYHAWRDGVLLTPPLGAPYDSTGGDERLLFGDYTSQTFGNFYKVQIDTVAYDQSGAYPPLSTPLYDGLIGSDLDAAMAGQQSSCYLRIPFTVTGDPGVLTSLVMDVQYDDGWVAYLNGVPVASRHAPVTPAWDDTALLDRPDTAAMISERVDLGHALSQLQAGVNMLAVHALNSAPGASRFLLRPALAGAADGREAYFQVPTPGSVTGPGSTMSQAWTDHYFTPAEQSIPAVSGDLADPDQDGVVNVFEYLYFTDPRQVGVNPLQMELEAHGSGPEQQWYLTARFPWRAGVGNWSHTVQTNDDLHTLWNEGPGPHTVPVSDHLVAGTGTRRIVIRDVRSTSEADHRVMRLRIDRL